MATELGDAAVEAANLALKMGSAAVDMVSFLAELGEELPVIGPALKTLTAFREKAETVKSNQEELVALEQRCTYMTACVIVKCKQNPSPGSGLNVTPLKDCIEAAGKFAERCSQRGKLWRVLKASSDKDELAALNARVDCLTGDLGLAGIATVSREVADLKGVLERMVKNHAAGQRELLENQRSMLDRLQSLSNPPAKMADVPQGTPTKKSWHVDRHDVMETVFEALIGEGEPRLVGLVGDSGSGKTTAASELVRSTEVREAFSDGILWLTVNDGAKNRLPSLMLQLARMVYDEVGRKLGCAAPNESGDGAAYIKQQMERGHGGKGLGCLMVADNVWEKDVVSKLLETGMSVLVSTRQEELITGAQGVPVRVDELSEADAESVLRKAAELSPGVRLPDDAVDLIELCGRVAMDLAFVGRWSIVRGRQDRPAWSDAAAKVRAEMVKIEGGPENGSFLDARTKRRKAVLRAGFEDLGTGSNDERVQRLYLSLAVMPDGRSFDVKLAAVLLYDREPGTEDEASVRGVIEILERWSVLRSTRWGRYFMHDAHSDFSRQTLMDRGHVRRPALRRWIGYISSLDVFRSMDLDYLKDLWLGVERVGGESWDESRPYEAALARMDEPDPVFHEFTQKVGRFQEAQGDWEKAGAAWRRLLEVSQASIGWRQFLDFSLGHSSHVPDDDGSPDVFSFVDDALPHLIICARNKNNKEEEAEWRNAYCEFLALCLVNMGLDEQLELLLHGYFHLSSETIPNDRETETFLRRSLEIGKARYGPEHVHVAKVLHQLGVFLHRRAERFEEAEGVLRQSLAMKNANLDPENAEVAKTLREIGICARKRGCLEDAEEMTKRALKMQQSKLPADDLEIGLTLHQLGVCARVSERFDEAEQLLRQSLRIFQGNKDMDGWKADALYEMGICTRESGGPAEEVDDYFRRSNTDREEAAAARLDFEPCVISLSVCSWNPGAPPLSLPAGYVRYVVCHAGGLGHWAFILQPARHRK